MRIKKIVWCSIGVLLVLIIGTVIFLAAIGWFDFYVNGSGYFFENSKYNVEYLVDDRSIEFEVDWNQRDIRLNKIRMNYEDQVYDIKVTLDDRYIGHGAGVSVWFVSRPSFRKAIIAYGRTESASDKFDRITTVTARLPDGTVIRLPSNGGGYGGDKNTRETGYGAEKGFDDNESFVEQGKFVLIIEDILLYKFTRI